MSGQHAILSPSGFRALMLCPAKPAMERGLPDDSSDYADEGTAAHYLGSTCLDNGMSASKYLGMYVAVSDTSQSITTDAIGLGKHYAIDADFAMHVQTYIDTVHDYLGDGSLFVEQALPIGHITGEEGAEGTGDAVILRGDELIVIDLKFGRGIEVEADDNPQLMLYALGALERFDLVGDIQRVRMVICQPRLDVVSEATMDVAALREWAERVATPAAQCAHMVWVNPTLATDYCNLHPDACRFCKAKSTCPALAASVQSALQAEFTDLTTQDATARDEIVQRLAHEVAPDNLGAKMDAVELVEMWCKAIRARAESELLAGRGVAGWKLVAGRKSARQWADAIAAEAELKRMRLKKEQMYDLSLISPTTAEKLLKAQPKRWKKVQPLIVQNDGKPSVAPVADKRPALAIQPVESEFEVIAETAEDLV